MEQLRILKTPEHCIFTTGEHSVAHTAKKLEMTVVSEEMGNEFHKDLGYKAVFPNIFRLAAPYRKE